MDHGGALIDVRFHREKRIRYYDIMLLRERGPRNRFHCFKKGKVNMCVATMLITILKLAL